MTERDHEPHQRDENPHHEHASPDPRAVRAEALEQLLTERGLVTEEAIEAVLQHYEQDVGPMNGARVVARAWLDPAYRARLLEDGSAAIAELGLGGPQADRLVVVENTPTTHNVIVCTLCSCYPWPVLGLPPAWYKDPAYRSRIVREPRAVLREFGLELEDDVEVRVWDSSAEIRYMVLPERPPSLAEASEDALAERVTRDAMLGVARVSP
jgi:nitrile hydratase